MVMDRSVDEVLSMPEKDYVAYVRKLLGDPNWIQLLDELDDQLLSVVEERPADVEWLCKKNAKIYNEAKIGNAGAGIIDNNFNTLFASMFYQNRIEEAVEVFLKGIRWCTVNSLYYPGKSLAYNIFNLINKRLISLDDAPFFLKNIVEMFTSIGKSEDAIEALCAAAMHFADVSAFQAAYRALDNAQKIAMDGDLIQGQIEVLSTQGMVALLEGDHDCADLEFNKVFALCSECEEEPSFAIKANAALVKLRKDDYLGAIPIYENLLQSDLPDIDTVQREMIPINLLICYREVGDKRAAKGLSKRIEKGLGSYSVEIKIEALLVLAKTYYRFNEPKLGSKYLKEACVKIQTKLDQYSRLHYRRGVREQYVPRVKSMLSNVDESGDDDAVYPLIFCSSNALLDWLSVLDWCDQVQHSKEVPNQLKSDLISKRDALIDFGTPYLYGFREKYDDPFQSVSNEKAGESEAHNSDFFDYSLPWRGFNEIIGKINHDYYHENPFKMASLEYIAGIIKYRLGNASAFMFTFACVDGCVIVLLCEDSVAKCVIPIDNSMDYVKSLIQYQHGDLKRQKFIRILMDLSIDISSRISDMITTLEDSKVSDLTIISDWFTESFPVIPNILNSKIIRERIKQGRFTIRTCNALKEESEKPELGGPALFVSDSSEDLLLASSEMHLLKNLIKDSTVYELDLKQQDMDFSAKPLSQIKHLHLATHNIAAAIFTDPMFVGTSHELYRNSMRLEQIQRYAHKLPIQLIFLNGCNTGTTGNKNYFKAFSTTEKVGLTSVYLLNRKCAVIASKWNVPELIGFVFTYSLYKQIAAQNDACEAFTKALVEIYEMNKSEAKLAIHEIQDNRTAMRMINNIEKAINECPFNEVYVLGMYQYHGLLSKTKYA